MKQDLGLVTSGLTSESRVVLRLLVPIDLLQRFTPSGLQLEEKSPMQHIHFMEITNVTIVRSTCALMMRW